MKLCIVKNCEAGFNEDIYQLATSMLSAKSVHLFIAANSWDSIELELDDSIPDDCLKTFALAETSIRVKLPEQITQKTVKLLCDLFKDKAGAIRKSYMMGGDVKGVISECLL